MALFSEESFGPVLSIIRARDAAHAVELANGSRFGLSASVWATDVMAALAVARELESGAVHINSTTVHDEAALPVRLSSP
jgi:benzaldehyde dehydrogenase (NAD)